MNLSSVEDFLAISFIKIIRAAGTYLNMVRTDLFELDSLAPSDPLLQISTYVLYKWFDSGQHIKAGLL